ncbi:cupin domain-containing protein [Actinomadura sp. SCN-SB]|uniref:cupin domain-containing protein n=1 Tax=Actinomadura sp. SCN-SB TaxID=3373092 RepID=UPI00375024D0
MPLHAVGDAVTEHIVDMGNTTFSTKAVYGNNSSLMVATRPAGYHSKPHFHDCEQLNLLQEGELWVFIEDRAFHLKAGDFLRIPEGKIHWSWNKSGKPCVLIEVHTPGLHADPLVSGFAVALHDEGETPRYLGSPSNRFLPDDEEYDTSVAENQAG